MPFSSADQFDRLIELGALDAGLVDAHRLAAVMPDSVTPTQIAQTLGVGDVTVSAAVGRDTDSVWILSQRPIHIGRLRLLPAHHAAEPDAIRLTDAPAFGTGLHPTTALCLEILDDILMHDCPDSVLDVGIGSGVLALAALTLGVRRVHGIDIDDEALRVAAENARLNRMEERLDLTSGGPDAVTGSWPLVLANVLAAPLIEMAPVLVRRLGHHGLLLLSGIPASAESDVSTAYQRLGLRLQRVMSRGGWVALILRASWCSGIRDPGSGIRKAAQRQYGTPVERCSRSAAEYHSSSPANRAKCLSAALSFAPPHSSRASCTRGMGNRLGMLGIPNSQSIARNCIAALTPPNWPAE